MKKAIDKLIKVSPALSIILLPAVFWTIIFLIQVSIGHFMSPQLIAIVAALSGVFIGSYVNYIKNN